MKFDHNQICTTGHEVVVGNQYQYSEDGYIADVTILADEGDDEGIGFKLRVDKPLNGGFAKGAEFSCWAAKGHYAYSGMWRLYDLDTYAKP